MRTTDPAPRAARLAWCVFAIMFALMVLDHVDRQIVVSMFPLLKARWGLSDGELGVLVSVVAITVALGTIPLSIVAERWGQLRSLFWMAVIWSGATIACAFAARYGELLLARAIVGVGEAAYGSVGCALLAKLFPERIRSTVLASFLVAALIGSVVGVMIGGVAIQQWGWRGGFAVAGVPGLVLAVLLLFIGRAVVPIAPAVRNEALWPITVAVFAALAKARSAPLACVAAGLQLISVSSLYAWLPSYFHREYGLASAQAGVAAGLVVLAGVPGAIVFGMTADALKQRLPAARYYLPAAAALLTAVFTAAAFGTARSGAMQLVCLILAAASMTGIVGPVTAAIIDVVPAFARATAAGVLAAAQNLFGLALGPVLIGVLSDRHGLASALTAVPLVCCAAGLLFVAAARAYPHDRIRVERLQPAAWS